MSTSYWVDRALKAEQEVRDLMLALERAKKGPE